MDLHTRYRGTLEGEGLLTQVRSIVKEGFLQGMSPGLDLKGGTKVTQAGGKGKRASSKEGILPPSLTTPSFCPLLSSIFLHSK